MKCIITSRNDLGSSKNTLLKVKEYKRSSSASSYLCGSRVGIDRDDTSIKIEEKLKSLVDGKSDIINRLYDSVQRIYLSYRTSFASSYSLDTIKALPDIIITQVVQDFFKEQLELLDIPKERFYFAVEMFEKKLNATLCHSLERKFHEEFSYNEK